MLFAVVYTYKTVTEEAQERTLKLFTNWTPPAGYEFKAHYECADETGGVAIVEAATAAAVLEAHSPWGPYIDFKTAPVVDVQQAVPILQKAWGWRASVR